MAMKFLRVMHVHLKRLLGRFLDKYPGFQEKPYSEQMDIFKKERIYHCGSFSNGINFFGHECEELIFDLDWLQKRWALENSFNYDDQNWKQEIIFEQIRKYEPDVLLFQHNSPLDPDSIRKLRNECHSIKIIAVHTAFLGESGSLDWADLILAGTPSIVHRYAQRGVNARLFYHYFDESLINDLDEIDEKKLDLSFCGTSGFGYGLIHSDRNQFLKKLLDSTKIEMWLNEGEENPEHKLSLHNFRNGIIQQLARMPKSIQNFMVNCKGIPKKISNMFIESLKIDPDQLRKLNIPQYRLKDIYPDRVNNGLVGLDYFKLIQNSTISIHIHGNNYIQTCGDVKNDVGAIRLFEVTGLGSCLVTDTGSNMNDLFDEDNEIVTYSNFDEAVEKINYLLEHRDYAHQISIRGQKRTLKCHTNKKRCEQFIEWCKESI